MKWDHSLIDTLEWGNQISHKEDKIKIADLIASKVENGQVIGVGSGSTSYLALIRIAERIRTERLSILAIPTSSAPSKVQSGLWENRLVTGMPSWAQVIRISNEVGIAKMERRSVRIRSAMRINAR